MSGQRGMGQNLSLSKFIRSEILQPLAYTVYHSNFLVFFYIEPVTEN